ncbi:5'-nucleotidase C-terminal domain-containing protein [Thermodesulfovibrionales bacterium]|nr:5'-nucleotidase C-terminal domain-containing protein [Thermodesulfovibrionales bacterium]
MRKRIKSLIIVAVMLVSASMVTGCFGLFEEEEPAVEEPIVEEPIVEEPIQTNITILHTGDLHGRLEPFKPRRAEEYVGGIARIATLVAQIKAEQPNTILIDAGDTIHGTNLSNLFYGEPVIAAMNQIGFTAMVVGNHDFNYGADVLLKREKQAEFPLLGANVRCQKSGNRFLPPYTIVEVGGLKIGIIGLVATDTPIKTHPKNVKGLEFLDPVKTTKEIVEQLDPRVDLIVLLAHMCCNEEIPVIEQVPGIAVSVSANCHKKWVERIDNTILIDSYEHGKVLGRLDIVVENGRVIDFTHEYLPITPVIKEDAVVDALLIPYKDELGERLAEEIGVANVFLDGEREDIRSRETNLGNLIADAIREKAGADVAIQNSGGIRASIDKGPITLEEIFTVLPFDNYVLALRLTGETIWKALENAVSDESPTGAFPQISGMSFVFDRGRPSGDRIIEVLIDGKPLDLEKTYIVATNCFLAAGGDKFTMLKGAEVVLDTGALLRDVVAAYIRERRTVSPIVEDRIRAVGVAIDQVDIVCADKGLPVRLGEEVTIEGVATVGTGVISTDNTFIFVQDGTGGIAIFERGIDVPVQKGDRVRITGEVGHFHGLTQLVNPQIEILGHNNPLPQVKPIDNLGRLTQFKTAEPLEGELVSVHVRISAIPDRPRGGAYNVAVTDIHGENRIIVRVGPGTEINVQELKVDNEYIITGIVGQRDLFKPHQEGYRIFPRSKHDLYFKKAGTPPIDTRFPASNKVAAVVDGDGIMLQNPVVIDGNEVFEVRLVGIDAPETFSIEGFAYYNQVRHGERATEALRRLLPIGTEIRLKTGPRKLCGLGRLLAVIKLDGTDVNKKLLQQGYVVTFVVWPNSYDHGRFEALRSAMLEAKKFERGIWCATDPLEEIPLVYRDRIFGHPRYIGDFETKRYVRFERMEEIPLKNRVYFFRHDAVVEAGYTPK